LLEEENVRRHQGTRRVSTDQISNGIPLSKEVRDGDQKTSAKRRKWCVSF